MKYVLSLIAIFLAVFFYLKFINYSNKTIVLGSSLPKTGIMEQWGKSVEIGTNAYFKYVNEKKLLPDNKKIRLVTLNDKYEPDLTLENTKKLLKRDDLFALYGYVGTPTVKNILHLLEDSNIPFIAPFTGASFLRDINNKNFINFRASYKQEIEKIVEYLYNKKDIRKFAVFYQNDNYGEEGYISLITSLEKRDLKLVGEGTYKRNTLSIKHAFKEIKNSEPEAILMVGSYKANALFIQRALEDEKFKKTVFCNISFGDANEIIKELDENSFNNIIFSQVVPSPNDPNVEVIKEYRFLMHKYYPNEPLGFISLESFLAAKTVVAAIKDIKGSITYEKFRESIKNTIKEIESKSKNEHLLNKTYLFKYINSKFVEIDCDKK